MKQVSQKVKEEKKRKLHVSINIKLKLFITNNCG